MWNHSKKSSRWLIYSFILNDIVQIHKYICLINCIDNIISLTQSGDTLELGIEQIGYDNEIKMLDANSYITAGSLGMYLVQFNTSSSSLPNSIIFDEISGTGNKMKLGQGIVWDVLDSETNLDWSHDGSEGGGHEIDITMYGD